MLNRETFCDKCMDSHPSREYTEPLHYDKENEDFRCPEGHIEDASQFFRHDSKEYLIETIMELLNENWY